jgi:hypothetical protein
LTPRRSVRVWLRNIVRVREKKDCDLFVWDARNIDSAVNAFTRLIPINLSGSDCHTHTCAAVAELD